MLHDFPVALFKSPFEVASASLYLHVESVPVDHTRNNTSDKKLWNNLYAKP